MADMIPDLIDRVVEQYGGALYERNGSNLSPLDSGYIPDDCHILPPQPEQAHLYVRIPLITQRLRDRVQTLYEPTQNITMAPGYRANNQSRRANRSYVDHDVFEGLPVRNWRRDTVTIAPPPVHEISTQKDKWDVELPWGMPKDSHLLPQHSQDLLRAARSGRLYVRRPPAEEEEVDAEATLGDKPDKKDEDPKEKGFSVKTWKLVPKHQEGPEIEFLAKRRKGLTGTTVKTTLIPGPMMTKARVKRTDAAGNTYIEDVVVVEGQALEGELISQTVIVDSAVGSVGVDTVPALSIPPRRRPPPPKRKAKGPGRGRKRKLPLAPTSVPGESGAVKLEAENEGTGILNGNAGSEGIKREDSDVVNNENENEDMEMGDDNLNPSEEEGEDVSDDDDQSDGEGPGGHDEDDVDSTQTKHPELARTETNESADAADDHGAGQDHARDVSSSPELPLAAIGSTVGHEHGTAGSPLRNMVTFAPTFEERSPNLISESEAEAEGDDDELAHHDIHENLQEEVDGMGMQGAYHIQQDQDFSAVHVGDGMSMGQNQSYLDDGEMLLDADMSGMDFSNMEAEHGQFPEHYSDDEEEIMPVPVQESQDQIHHPDLQNFVQGPHISAQDGIADRLAIRSSDGVREEEEDNFEDLLGSLEDHLNEQGQGLAVEHVDDNAKSEDEVAHVPAPDDFEVAHTAPETVEDAIVHLNENEITDTKPAQESNAVDEVVDVEIKDTPAEEVEETAPESIVEE